MIVNLDGTDYRVTSRAGRAPLIYERKAIGAYFKWRLIWGDKNRCKPMKPGTIAARVMAVFAQDSARLNAVYAEIRRDYRAAHPIIESRDNV